MKRKILVGALAFAMAMLILSTVLQGPPYKGEGIANVQQDMQSAIRAAGYQCDAISYAGRLAVRTGFRVTCDGDRYAYSITDESGQLVVRRD
jgi:hypothetical protein